MTASWRLLARFALALAWARLLVARGRYQPVLRQAMAGAEGESLPAERAAAAGRALARAGRLPGLGGGCLPRALAAWRVLSDLGYAARVRVGVRASRSVVEAHAWVESGGVVFGDRADIGEHFRAFTMPDEIPDDLPLAAAAASAAR